MNKKDLQKFENEIKRNPEIQKLKDKQNRSPEENIILIDFLVKFFHKKFIEKNKKLINNKLLIVFIFS